MEPREYRVDFSEKGPGQKRFHKGFTFTYADSSEAAAQRIKDVRPGSEVEIVNITEVKS